MKKLVSIILLFALLLSFSGCIFESGYNRNDTYINDTPLSNSNPYVYYYSQYYDYILADSCSRYLNWQDLYGLSAQELYLAEQEIYARHGYTFSEWDVQEYFDNRGWYQPSQTQEELSEYASMNAYFIGVFTAVQDGSIYGWGNPYLALCSNDFVLSFSSSRELTDSDLAGLSSKELAIARNEIFARHGYIFGDTDLRTYFYTKPWYRPSSPGSQFNYGGLSELETANVELIQYYEDITPPTDSGNGGTNAGNGGNSGNSGNSGNTSENSSITTIDKYTYIGPYGCFHIPYVDLPTASAINREMYDVHYGSMNRYNIFSNPDGSSWFLGMTYTVSRSGDIVSVLVREIYDTGCDAYYVYNFSASSGQKLSDAAIYSAFGLSETDGRDLIYAAISGYWENSYWFNTEQNEFAQQQRDLSLQPENIAKWRPYINASGSLCFTGPIYAVAGGAYYEHLLDQYGNGVTAPSCYMH